MGCLEFGWWVVERERQTKSERKRDGLVLYLFYWVVFIILLGCM